MVKIANTLNVGPSGTNVTKVSTAESGDEVTHVIFNNSAVNNGNPGIQYSNDLVGAGVPISVRYAADSGITHLRYDVSGVPGSRFVARRGLYLPAGYTAGYAAHNLITIRLATSVASGVSLNLGNIRPRLYIGASSAPGSTSGPVLPTGQILWAEIAVTPVSAEGAGDGVIAYRITDADENEIATDTMTGVDILPTPAAMYLFGGGRTSGFASYDYVWDIQAGPLASGWWGPLSETTPLTGLNPTITGHTRPSAPGASDGSITIAWGAVPNAGSYETYLDSGSGPVRTSTSATSPHTFNGLGAGEYEPFVQAMP